MQRTLFLLEREIERLLHTLIDRAFLRSPGTDAAASRTATGSEARERGSELLEAIRDSAQGSDLLKACQRRFDIVQSLSTALQQVSFFLVISNPSNTQVGVLHLLPWLATSLHFELEDKSSPQS